MASGPRPHPSGGIMYQILFDFAGNDQEPAFPMAVGEQPQQRLETFGVQAVSDTELLAMILQGPGMSASEAVTMASRLIAEAGSIAAFLSWQPNDYRRTKRIGQFKASQLTAISEIARRMMMPRTAAPLLNRPELIAEHFRPIVQGLPIEKFWVVLLNRKNRLIKRVEITSGTATAALAHPREVFRAVLREGGATPVTSVACIHNHPSGSPEPSAADIHVTRQLREAAKALDLDLADHVIIGDVASDPSGLGYYSFRSAGLL